MALVALNTSWELGDSSLSPGFVVNVPANYGNLGSYARWNRRLLSAMAPFSPGNHNPTWTPCGPAPWHAVSQPNIGAMSNATANTSADVAFSAAGPSQTTGSAAATAAADSSGTPASVSTLKSLL